jgi:hypothetical protein
MITVMAPAGLVPLQAPLPAPRRFDLLSTLEVLEPADDRWLGGAWTGGDVPGPAFTHDPCSTGTVRSKDPGGVVALQTSAAFAVYLPGFCSTQSIGPDPEFWTDRLKRIFEIYESAAVERVLATGDGHTVLGPYLGNANLEILHGGLAIDPVQAYGLLEQAVARHGGGVIHVAPRTFAAWKSANLITTDGAILRSELGTPIVVGYGYVGVTPDNGTPPTPTQEWAFASGAIEVIRDSRIDVLPSEYEEAIYRPLNDAVFIAERPYLLNWLARQDPDDHDHVQAGVLVDCAPFASNFIIVGGGGSGIAYAIETPAGVIDGLNDTFTLSTVPSPAADLLLWKNGLYMTQGDDYTLAGSTITFGAAQIPPAASILVAAVPS